MEWISVEKELPKEKQNVLVTTGEDPFVAMLDRFDPQYINALTWYIKGAPWRGGNWDKDPEESKITHWMPLPEPSTIQTTKRG